METGSTSARKLGVAVAVVTLVLGVAGVVAAQTGPSAECTGGTIATFGEEFFGLEDQGNRLLSTSPTAREYPLSLEAGTYTLDAVSYDGYEKREEIAPQTQEQWFAEFLASDGSVLATSGITGDLEDEVPEATWSGAIGEVTLASPASAIRVVHAAPGSASVNSVRPVCVGATNTAQEPVVEETTTTTTEAPAPKSSLSVDFVSTASSASTVSATCGELTESASGTEISLSITGIAQSTGCVVAYPATLECTMAIDPTSVTGAAAPGVQNLLMPAVGAVDAAMTIDCVEPQVASVVETTTTTAPAAAAPTTTVAPTTEKVAVEVEVADQVETAPAATAQTGQPAFTG